MALKLVVDTLDGIGDAEKTLYVEKDGKFHLDVDGLEDTSGLKSALQKERDSAKQAAKALKDLQSRFEGIDPDKVREMMKKFEGDDEAALIAAGKIDELVSKRFEKMRKELEKQSEKALKDAQTAAETAAEKAKKYSQRVLDNALRSAAAKAGLHQHAIEDALFRGRAMFTLNEDGDAMQLDADGDPVLGKDGKTPFSPLEWLESMKETAPHWFPAGGSGGGASGSGSGAGGAGKTIKRSVFNALTPTEKAEKARTHTIID